MSLGMLPDYPMIFSEVVSGCKHDSHALGINMDEQPLAPAWERVLGNGKYYSHTIVTPRLGLIQN